MRTMVVREIGEILDFKEWQNSDPSHMILLSMKWWSGNASFDQNFNEKLGVPSILMMSNNLLQHISKINILKGQSHEIFNRFRRDIRDFMKLSAVINIG